MHTYLLINILTILFPVAFSFEKHVYFFKQWKYVFFSSAIVSIPFILWDWLFTLKGVWGFNPRYVVGIYIGKLPLEEILFFFCIPFACIFIYEIVRYFQPTDILQPYARRITYSLAAVLFVLGAVYNAKVYTTTTFVALSIALVLHLFLVKSDYRGYFYQTYIISVVPFLIVNGLLTNGVASVSANPVVWYDNAQNLGIRVLGIPIEDFFYSMLLLLLNVTIYERLRRR